MQSDAIRDLAMELVTAQALNRLQVGCTVYDAVVIEKCIRKHLSGYVVIEMETAEELRDAVVPIHVHEDYLILDQCENPWCKLRAAVEAAKGKT